MAKLLQRGDPRVAPLSLTRAGEARSDTDMPTPELDGRCDECGSTYRAALSAMASLCPECAHHLYGYAACPHRMVAGRCTICGWDGSESDYVASLKAFSDQPKT